MSGIPVEENAAYQPLTFDHYQNAAHDTAIQPLVELGVQAQAPSPAGGEWALEDGNWVYPLTGLVGEVGEVSQHLSKAIRDRQGHLSSADDMPKLERELGDVLWYLTELATRLGFSMEDIARRNLTKLADRQRRGVLGGSGDAR